MASIKRVHDLIAIDSDKEEEGYNSEDEPTKSGTRKRRRTSLGSNGDEEIDGAENLDLPDNGDAQGEDLRSSAAVGASTAQQKSKARQQVDSKSKSKSKKASHPGIIYLSRIPPFMKPTTLRSLLGPHGTITRLYLTPETSTSFQARRRAGGNRKRSYIDGWVEFAKKSVAKRVAQLLNAQIIGGKKCSWYHDDLWNMRYLKGFRWADLMEQMVNEEKEREVRMAAEMRRQKKEDRLFLEGVQSAKVMKTREEKAKRKGEGKEGGATGERGIAVEESEGAPKIRRGLMSFRQNEVKDKAQRTKSTQRADVQKVLGQIF